MGTFENFEETYEGLVTRDPENKKLILDQVSFALQIFVYTKKEMFLILFYPQIFREFLTNVLLPTSTKEPDVPACRKFVTEFAIQVVPQKNE